MSKNIFLFTISPVQTFIEQARKTIDLYAGSQILSNLITYAMEETKRKSSECDFIFPVFDQGSKPNRFIAIITPPAGEEMQKFGNQIKAITNIYFVENMGKKVIDLFPAAKNQLENFLNIYWVANEYIEHEKSYPEQIKQLERNLGAVKNVRNFEQLIEKGRKCSINGEYNVKFYRRHEEEQDTGRLYEKKLFQKRADLLSVASDDFELIDQKDLNPGEGLSAISMLKRLYSEDSFPSTARIALLDTLTKNKIADDFLRIVKSLNGGYVDEQIYYENNTSDAYFRKQGYKQLLDKIKSYNFLKEFGKMKKSIKEENLQLSKYYAILAFDVDSMGDLLQRCVDKEEHTRVSKLLANFAKEVSDYLDKSNYGRTVYAGGDDFLGFININHLFLVMKKMRKMLDVFVNQNIREGLQMTLSAGVAIAHYKTPLSEVLRWTRKMEKEAKSVLHSKDNNIKKDSFSIAVLKRSGEIHFTTCRWKGYEDRWTPDLFKRLTGHLKKKEVSKKFITNLSSEYNKRLDQNGKWGKRTKPIETELNEMLAFETEYFIKRATSPDEVAKNAMKGFALELYNNFEYHLRFDLSVQNYLNMLHICEFITREINPIEESGSNQFTKTLEAITI